MLLRAAVCTEFKYRYCYLDQSLVHKPQAYKKKNPTLNTYINASLRLDCFVLVFSRDYQHLRRNSFKYDKEITGIALYSSRNENKIKLAMTVHQPTMHYWERYMRRFSNT